MMLVAFKTVSILHFIGMSLVTIQAIQSLSMTWMTFTTLQFCMGTGETLHFLSRFLMTTETDSTQIRYGPEINISGGVRVVTLQTLASCKMVVIAGIMTISTGWYDPFLTGWMFCMAIYTGKIFKMCSSIVCEILHCLFVAGTTMCTVYGRIPTVGSGLMGRMTGQTVCNLHFSSMPFMTIETCLILSFGQAMLSVTLKAILFFMGTGHGCQKITDIFVAGHTDRFPFLNSSKI